ncbi:MAG: major capsid protein [Planctomycetota bacterium]
MPNDLLTISDVIADALDLADVEVSDLERAARFVAMLTPEEASDGTTHKYVKEVGAPVVGFRSVNAGRDLDHSEDVLVSADLAYLDLSFMVDVALADKRRGRNNGRAWMLAREGARSIASALFKYEEQLLYGQAAGDAAGFEGFLDQASLEHTDSAMVVDAGGTTAGNASSVFGVRVGRNDVSAVYNGDEPATLKEETVQQVLDATGKPYNAYVVAGGSWLGLQVGAAKSIGRICNLTEDAGKGLTDELLAQLLAKYPSSRPPTHWLCSRRSLFQLRASRTATNPTGAPAPLPTEAFGIPLLDLDSIRDTETLATAA